jgi:hypothetical protein
LQTLTDTLMERVNKLVQPGRPLGWGDPLLSATPTAVAIHELAARTEALENAVREIALEVQKLAGGSALAETRSGQERAEPR